MQNRFATKFHKILNWCVLSWQQDLSTGDGTNEQLIVPYDYQDNNIEAILDEQFARLDIDDPDNPDNTQIQTSKLRMIIIMYTVNQMSR